MLNIDGKRKHHWALIRIVVLTFLVSATAFYKCQSVLEFLHEMLDMEPDTIRRPLSDSQRIRFAKEIKGTCTVHVHVLFWFIIIGMYIGMFTVHVHV